MRYNININQLAIIEQRLDIDLYDAAIISFVSDWIGNSSATIVNYEGLPYTWISHKLITDQIPMLRTRTNAGLKTMSKDTIYRRMKRLCDIGLLDKHPNSQKLGMPLYRGTKKLDDIKYGAISVPTDADPKGYGHKSEGGTGLDPNYNSIKDNSINNNREREKEKIPPQNLEVKESLDNLVPVKDEEKKPKEKSSAKKEKVVEYPSSFSDSMITACKAWFEYRRQIGYPFSNVYSKQTRVMAWQAEVAEYGENIVIASIYEAISQDWRKTYPKPNTDKKYFKGSKQPKQAKKREVDGVLMSKLDGLKSRGIITYDRMNEILSWDSDEEISIEVDKLMQKPQQL